MNIGEHFRKRLVVSCCLLLLAVAATAVDKPPKTVYDYSLVSFDNKEVSLSSFKGKVLLIVNLASQSIFRDQISLLDDLQKSYKDKGLVVIGIPSNDFGAQEPGSDADVQKMYSTDLHLSFPIFARTSVRGKDQIPLYGFLTADKKGPTGGEVHWSFTKFIVDRNGKVVARFEPHIAPNAPELQVTIADVLAGTYKSPAPKNEEDEKKPGDREEDKARQKRSRSELSGIQPPHDAVGEIG